jgi:hypothetical protein
MDDAFEAVATKNKLLGQVLEMHYESDCATATPGDTVPDLIFLEVHPTMISADEANGRIADLVAEVVCLGYPRPELNQSSVSVEDLAVLREVERLVLRSA